MFKRFVSIPPGRRLLRRAANSLIRPPRREQDFAWKALPPGPCARFDAGVVQIGHLMYCFGGYSSEDCVLSVVDLFDMRRCRWIERIPMPAGMPQSHLALATEANRYIYSAGGQLGPHCRPAVADVFVLDTRNRTWRSLPALPEPRYAATMQFWRGRLHVLGGTEPDRYTPAREHWSLGIREGKAAEDLWQIELPVPRGGGHRASAVVQDRLYLFGGQEGDFVAIPGDPDYACTGETVTYVHSDVYRWDPSTDYWARLADMPVSSSHIEFSVVVHGDRVLIAGGTSYKDPETFAIELTDVIQVFDTHTGKWAIQGHLPFRVATCLMSCHNGRLYVTSGIRDRSREDASPGPVESSTWRANLLPMSQSEDVDYLAFVKGRRILLVSHELSITGAPLMLIEIGAALQRSGADVALVNLGAHEAGFPLPTGEGFRTAAVEQSFELASGADLIVANTAVANTWVRDLLTLQPGAGRKMIWCIHEIDTEAYGNDMSCLREAAAVVFDSDACREEWQRIGYQLGSAAKVIHPCVQDVLLRGGGRLRRSSRPASWLRRQPDRAGGSSREEVRSELGVRRKDFLVSLFGTYCALKGQDLLVRTIGHMLELSPGLPLKLLLIGFLDDEMRDKFVDGLTAREYAAIDARRALRRAVDLRPYFRASDAFILNTQQPGETFGRVTIEAMAFGLPILATDTGGTREIVIDGVTGLLHPPGEKGQAKLAGNILDLLHDRRKARSFGAAGLRRVEEHFTESRFYKELSGVVEIVISKSRASAADRIAPATQDQG